VNRESRIGERVKAHSKATKESTLGEGLAGVKRGQAWTDDGEIAA